MAKLFIKTYGCQMNEYDSELIAGVLAEDAAYERAADPDEADLILVNTCSVRAKAQEKLFGELGRLRALKERSATKLIGVGGCVASQEGAAILKRAPYVDLVFGPQTLHRLPAMLKRRRKTGRPQVDLDFPAVEKFDNLPAPGVVGVTAYVSVMEGCSKYCSFCVVPYTRGPELSRPLMAVLDEVAELALRGVREVTLLGQNVNAYAGAEPDGRRADFARLLECVAAIEGITRIRYLTSHPVNFTDRLIAAHGAVPNLMPSVHLPVQSGDDRILMAMKRGYTAIQYRSIVRRLRAACAQVSLSTDLIVGFPSETDEQFERTLELVRTVGFDGGYAFIYSARPGTPAARLPDPVPAAVKKERLRQVQQALNHGFAVRNKEQVGRTLAILVEGPARRGDHMTGRAPDRRVVNFAGPASPGTIVKVQITAARRFILQGCLAA